jgi:predicted GIY-YIG superfamily endonuclease
MSKQYYVYIMTNKNNRVLYTGITNDLKKRVYEHKEKFVNGFTPLEIMPRCSLRARGPLGRWLHRG